MTPTPTPTPAPLAVILRDARVRSGLTQRELAARAGVARGTIVNWERERVPGGDLIIPMEMKLLAVARSLGLGEARVLRALMNLKIRAATENSGAPTEENGRELA